MAVLGSILLATLLVAAVATVVAGVHTVRRRLRDAARERKMVAAAVRIERRWAETMAKYPGRQLP